MTRPATRDLLASVNRTDNGAASGCEAAQGVLAHLRALEAASETSTCLAGISYHDRLFRSQPAGTAYEGSELVRQGYCCTTMYLDGVRHGVPLHLPPARVEQGPSSSPIVVCEGDDNFVEHNDNDVEFVCEGPAPLRSPASSRSQLSLPALYDSDVSVFIDDGVETASDDELDGVEEKRVPSPPSGPAGKRFTPGAGDVNGKEVDSVGCDFDAPADGDEDVDPFSDVDHVESSAPPIPPCASHAAALQRVGFTCVSCRCHMDAPGIQRYNELLRTAAALRQRGRQGSGQPLASGSSMELLRVYVDALRLCSDDVRVHAAAIRAARATGLLTV